MALEEANALEPLAVIPCILQREATTLVGKVFLHFAPGVSLPPFAQVQCLGAHGLQVMWIVVRHVAAD